MMLLPAICETTRAERARYEVARLRRIRAEAITAHGWDASLMSGRETYRAAKTAIALPGGGVARNRVECADVMAYLRGLPSGSVNCVVTSPPYFGLRDYGVAGPIGSEPTPKEFVATMVTVFREVRRVLRDDGVCWLNLGDSYWSNTATQGRNENKSSVSTLSKHGINGRSPSLDKQTSNIYKRTSETHKSKDLLMIPARVAIALQDDGWTLRSEIVWHKPNPMPESVTDRPTKSHEMVYMLTKSPTYWYDQDAIREKTGDEISQQEYEAAKQHMVRRSDDLKDYGMSTHQSQGLYGHKLSHFAGRNARTVWTVATEPQSFAHFATFPRKLIEPMILAGCPAQTCSVCGAPWRRVVERELVPDGKSNKRGLTRDKFDNRTEWGKVHGYYAIREIGFCPTCDHDAPTVPGIVLDIFMGSGTSALVARDLGRDYMGCDLNPEYVAIAHERLRLPFEPHHVKHETRLDDLPLFAPPAPVTTMALPFEGITE